VEFKVPSANFKERSKLVKIGQTDPPRDLGSYAGKNDGSDRFGWVRITSERFGTVRKRDNKLVRLVTSAATGKNDGRVSSS